MKDRFFNVIDSVLWGDRAFRHLSKSVYPDSQKAWLFLLTGPHQRGLPGLFDLRASEIADRLGYQAGDVVSIFTELSGAGMAFADWEAGVVFLPNVFKHNPPDSGNNVTGYLKRWKRIPESDLKLQWVQALMDHAEERGGDVLDKATATFGKYAPAAGGILPPLGPPAEPSNININSKPKKKEASDIEAMPNPIPIRTVDIMALNLADKLKRLILHNNPKAKVPKDGSVAWANWCGAIDKLNRIDGYGWSDIDAVMTWSQRDTFWRANILSGPRLRDKFDQLLLQAQRKAKGSGRNLSEMADLMKEVGNGS